MCEGRLLKPVRLTFRPVLGHDGHGLPGVLQGGGGLLVGGVTEVHPVHLEAERKAAVIDPRWSAFSLFRQPEDNVAVNFPRGRRLCCDSAAAQCSK